MDQEEANDRGLCVDSSTNRVDRVESVKSRFPSPFLIPRSLDGTLDTRTEFALGVELLKMKMMKRKRMMKMKMKMKMKMRSFESWREERKVPLLVLLVSFSFFPPFAEGSLGQNKKERKRRRRCGRPDRPSRRNEDREGS